MQEWNLLPFIEQLVDLSLMAFLAQKTSGCKEGARVTLHSLYFQVVLQ